jgi:hypothetical protein
VVDVPYGRLQGTKFFLGYNIKKKMGKKKRRPVNLEQI